MSTGKYTYKGKTYYYFQVPNPLKNTKRLTIKVDESTDERYKTKKQAQVAEARWLEAHKNDTHTVVQRVIYFEDVINDFISHSEKRSSKGTVGNYKNYYNKHLQDFVGLEVDKIKKIQVQKWLDDSIASGKSCHVINGCIKLVKASFNYALELDVVDRNPFQFVKNVPVPRIKRNRFSVEELQNLLVLCKEKLPQFYLMFVLLNLAGLRSGELKALTKDSTGDVINVFQQYYRGEIRAPKTDDSNRELEVGTYIQNAIKWHCAKYQIFNGFLFPSPVNKGKPIAHKTLDRYFHKLLRLAGYETGAEGEKHYMRVHDLRGQYADLMHMAGVPLVVTAKNMGHSNTKTTEKHYTQVLPEANKQAVNAIDNMFL